MFRELKRRQLYLNVSLMIFIMTVAFASVYFITYSNTNDIINKTLTEISIRPLRSGPPLKENGPQEIEHKFKEPLAMFAITSDLDGNILTYRSSYDLEYTLAEAAHKSIFSRSEGDGRLNFEGTHYAYRKIIRSEWVEIIFVDISTHTQILSKLIYTFLLVSLVMVLVIVAISNYLTNESIKPIKAAFQQQNQFISDASHEIKTPLAVIQSNTDVLQRDFADNQWLQNISSEVSRMKTLTESLLDLSRLESVDYSDTQILVDISGLSESVLLPLDAVAFENSIDFQYTIGDNLTCLGHQDQLIQVMMILLDNAFKYCKTAVNYNIATHNNYVVIEVASDGPILEDVHRKKIFNRFYKVDDSRRATSGGYGLGLAIAKSIVIRHHGKIYVEAREGFNVFVVKLHKIA